MNILYIWIYCSENGLIQNQGFNLAGEYEYHFDYETRTITSKRKDNYISNFFDNGKGVISDLSVIVGENGAGKTTLMYEIFRRNLVHHIDNSKEDISAAQKKQNENNISLIIFEEDGNIYYNHNLDFNINSPIQRKNVTVLNNITYIYISNSFEDAINSAMYHGREVLDYSLTDFTLSNQSKKIIEPQLLPKELLNDSGVNCIPHRELCNKIDVINKFVDISTEAYTIQKNLMSISFLESNLKETYFGKTIDNVKIVAKSIQKYTKNQSGFLFVDEDNDKINNIIGKVLEENELYNPTPFEVLVANLIVELLFLDFKEIQNCISAESGKYVNEQTLNNIRTVLTNLINRELNKCNEFGDSINFTTNYKIYEYYRKAIQDILDFKKIEDKIGIANNGWENDFAYEQFLNVDLTDTENLVFINNIKSDFFSGKSSFLIRYLNISFHKISSGEQALLNLYSRLFWIWRAQNCKKFNVVLIDEIDLYMHPQWQSQLIKSLVEDIPKIIPNSKAQLIISTHSPIFLSDIPRGNVIFLKKQNGKTNVENNWYHKSTFGSNIHMLFRDGFFMRSTIGEFAKSQINAVNSFLQYEISKLENDEIIKNIVPSEAVFNTSMDKETVRFIIDSIGEPIIKTKLNELYYRAFPQDELTEYKFKTKALTEKLKSISGGQNDELKQIKDNLLKVIENIDLLLKVKG